MDAIRWATGATCSRQFTEPFVPTARMLKCAQEGKNDMQRPNPILILAAGATLLATGCRIENNKQGDRNDVRIATPFGGAQVKTNDPDVLAAIGLPGYPGATLVHKDNGDKDNTGAADIHFSFGSFQFRVKAASYRTPDNPEKVLDFYRKALERFGSVIQCRDGKAVGTTLRTAEGLTCSDDDHKGDDDSRYTLKAGSRKHQHIVAISEEGGGSKFALVALDLPIDLHSGDDGTPDRKQ